MIKENWTRRQGKGRRDYDSNKCAFHEMTVGDVEELKLEFKEQLNQVKKNLLQLLPRWAFISFVAAAVVVALAFVKWNILQNEKLYGEFDQRLNKAEADFNRRVSDVVQVAITQNKIINENTRLLEKINTLQSVVISEQRDIRRTIRSIELNLSNKKKYSDYGHPIENEN